MKCNCGCGRETAVATKTFTARGWVKGQPMEYCQGHRAKRPAPPPKQPPMPETPDEYAAFRKRKAHLDAFFAARAVTDAQHRTAYQIEKERRAVAKAEADATLRERIRRTCEKADAEEDRQKRGGRPRKNLALDSRVHDR